ncbi:MAG: hypothetical protein OWT28_11820 [Firmicutes bacterium]|nr:hypothetical protein [Bacillota bacterium]
MRYHLIREAASALLWIAVIEVISSFAVKQLFNYNLTFTPYFFALGVIGAALFVLARLFR